MPDELYFSKGGRPRGLLGALLVGALIGAAAMYAALTGTGATSRRTTRPPRYPDTTELVARIRAAEAESGTLEASHILELLVAAPELPNIYSSPYRVGDAGAAIDLLVRSKGANVAADLTTISTTSPYDSRQTTAWVNIVLGWRLEAGLDRTLWFDPELAARSLDLVVYFHQMSFLRRYDEARFRDLRATILRTALLHYVGHAGVEERGAALEILRKLTECGVTADDVRVAADELAGSTVSEEVASDLAIYLATGGAVFRDSLGHREEMEDAERRKIGAAGTARE